MSHVANSMLETYNSLVDPSLAGYFNNDRTRKFLVKQRLITRRGVVVPEPVYRERFARESRQEYVNDMLARAIVHKALDNERRRQVTIRRKLEEIARLEHVRHVRADRDKNKAKLFERPRDSEALQTKSNSSPSRRGLNRRKKQQPNMLVRSAEPTSTRFITDEQQQRKAANDDDDDKEYSVSYGSDHADTNRSDRSGSARKSNSQPGTARSVASQPGSKAASGSNSSQKSSNSRKSVSGDRVSAQASHSSLRSASLESSLKQSDSEGTVKGRQPSRHSSRTLSRSRSSSSSTSSSSSASSSSKSVAEVKKVQKARDKKRALLRKLVSQKIDSKHLVNLDQAALIDYNRLLSGYGQSNARRFAPRPPEEKRTGRKRTVVRNRRGLRSDSAYRHTQRRNKSLERSGGSSARSLSIPRMPKSTERIKSLCKITLRFNGFKKTSEKERKKDDKTREFLKTVDRHTVIVEQQHCGGNTVEVFRGELYPETEFDFVSQRHRGFPFGISIYIDGIRDCRLSQCCEAKYKPGLQFGNKHFSFVRIVGGKPCYKCRMDAENPEEKDKKKNKKQKSERRPSASSDESELSPDEDDAPDEADADAPYQDEEFDQASEPLRLESPESDRQSEKANDENMDIEEVSNNGDIAKSQPQPQPQALLLPELVQPSSSEQPVQLNVGSVMMTLRGSDANAIRKLLREHGSKAEADVTVVISGNLLLDQFDSMPQAPLLAQSAPAANDKSGEIVEKRKSKKSKRHTHSKSAKDGQVNSTSKRSAEVEMAHRRPSSSSSSKTSKSSKRPSEKNNASETMPDPTDDSQHQVPAPNASESPVEVTLLSADAQPFVTTEETLPPIQSANQADVQPEELEKQTEVTNENVLEVQANEEQSLIEPVQQPVVDDTAGLPSLSASTPVETVEAFQSPLKLSVTLVGQSLIDDATASTDRLPMEDAAAPAVPQERSDSDQVLESVEQPGEQLESQLITQPGMASDSVSHLSSESAPHPPVESSSSVSLAASPPSSQSSSQSAFESALQPNVESNPSVSQSSSQQTSQSAFESAPQPPVESNLLVSQSAVEATQQPDVKSSSETNSQQASKRSSESTSQASSEVAAQPEIELNLQQAVQQQAQAQPSSKPSSPTNSSTKPTDGSPEAEEKDRMVGNPNMIEIIISWVEFAQNAALLLNPDVTSLFIEYRFLNIPTEQLETSALPKPAAGSKLNFSFRKLFPVDAEKHFIRRQFLSSMLHSGDEFVTFYVLSEPEDDDECEDVAVAKISLRQLLQDGVDYEDKLISLFDPEDGNAQVGVMCITVRALAALRTIKDEFPAPASEKASAASSSTASRSSMSNAAAGVSKAAVATLKNGESLATKNDGKKVVEYSDSSEYDSEFEHQRIQQMWRDRRRVSTSTVSDSKEYSSEEDQDDQTDSESSYSDQPSVRQGLGLGLGSVTEDTAKSKMKKQAVRFSQKVDERVRTATETECSDSAGAGSPGELSTDEAAAAATATATKADSTAVLLTAAANLATLLDSNDNDAPRAAKQLEDNEPSTQKVANGEDNESAQEKAEEGRNSEDEVQDDERPASENTDPQEVRDPTPVKSVSPSADTEFTEDEQDDSDVSSTSKAVEALHSSRTSLVNQEILDKAGFERTVEAVLKNSKPENLVINAVSELGDAEFEKLLDQVSESGAAQNYKRLTISGCEKLTAKAGQLIGANLKKFQRLETIEIANIDLADAGVKHLAEALKNHFIDCFDSESEDNTYRAFTLRKVILSSCNVGDKGVEAFGALLEMDIPIDTLHLLGCEFTISADTWSRFCSNLAKNNELQSLDISGSMLGDEKMITVLEGLMGNRALQYLGIRSNLCDGKCTEHLLKLIETHPKLRTVDFSYGNAFESDQMGLIDQALSKKAEDLDDN